MKALLLIGLMLLSGCSGLSQGKWYADVDQFPPWQSAIVVGGPAVSEEQAALAGDYYFRRSIGEDVRNHPYHMHAQ